MATAQHAAAAAATAAVAGALAAAAQSDGAQHALVDGTALRENGTAQPQAHHRHSRSDATREANNDIAAADAHRHTVDRTRSSIGHTTTGGCENELSPRHREQAAATRFPNLDESAISYRGTGADATGNGAPGNDDDSLFVAIANVQRGGFVQSNSGNGARVASRATDVSLSGWDLAGATAGNLGSALDDEAAYEIAAYNAALMLQRAFASDQPAEALTSHMHHDGGPHGAAFQRAASPSHETFATTTSSDKMTRRGAPAGSASLTGAALKPGTAAQRHVVNESASGWPGPQDAYESQEY